MRKIILILFGCTAILLAGYAGCRGYKVWKQNHLVTLARDFMARHDHRNALLSLNQALHSNPRNVEACRLMADLTEARGGLAALLWRSRVVELNPTSVDDRLSLARVALGYKDLTSASNALAGVSEQGRKLPGFQNLSGSLAVMQGNLADAESFYHEASRLDPTNPAPQLNLAIVRLRSTNDLVLTEARTALKGLFRFPAVRRQAMRELVADALRYNETNAALAISKELVLETNALFLDRLLRLDVLRAAGEAGFQPGLEMVQQEAAHDVQKIRTLASWEMDKVGPAHVLSWLLSLPSNVRTNPAVALAATDCYVALQDWAGLQSSLQRQYWDEMEFLRHALLARSMRGQNLVSSSKAEWDRAVKIVSGRKEGLVMLLRLAGQWKWLSESEDLLWTIVNNYPGEDWAFRALSQALFMSGRTRSLMSLYSQQAKANHADHAIKNNLAMCALLLDARELNPHQLAREVYENLPANAACAATYAFSLHLQSKSAEALKVLQQLKPDELEDPSIAGYYGLILKASGHKEKVGSYLDRGLKARLLPEERKLFEKARAGV